MLVNILFSQTYRFLADASEKHLTSISSFVEILI